MIIAMKKFGDILNSRPAGREAFLAFRPHLLHDLSNVETITIDFDGIRVLTPSFADEFVTPLIEQYPKRVLLKNTANITVQKVLLFLSRDWPKGAFQME